MPATALPSPAPLSVELPLDLVEAFDTWIGMQPAPRPTRPEALVLALRDWLTGQGLLPFHDGPEMAH